VAHSELPETVFSQLQTRKGRPPQSLYCIAKCVYSIAESRNIMQIKNQLEYKLWPTRRK